jgi:Kef-type K+ transport system membrane component KefB
LPSASGVLFPADRLVPLAALSQLGVLLFLFAVGLRLDRDALRGRLRAAVAVSHASIVVPFALGAALAPWLHPTLAGAGTAQAGVALLPFTLFLGTAMSVTAFPVLARILTERGLVGTRLGAVAIACAAVCAS